MAKKIKAAVPVEKQLRYTTAAVYDIPARGGNMFDLETATKNAGAMMKGAGQNPGYTYGVFKLIRLVKPMETPLEIKEIEG